MEEFVKWGNMEYGINAKPENYFLFSYQCEPVASRERMVREEKARPDHEKLMRQHSAYRQGFLDTERELDSLKQARRSKR